MKIKAHRNHLSPFGRHEQTAQTSKCSKFEIKAIALSVEFCAEHIKSGSGIPELENQVKKPSYAL